MNKTKVSFIPSDCWYCLSSSVRGEVSEMQFSTKKPLEEKTNEDEIEITLDLRGKLTLGLIHDVVREAVEHTQFGRWIDPSRPEPVRSEEEFNKVKEVIEKEMTRLVTLAKSLRLRLKVAQPEAGYDSGSRIDLTDSYFIELEKEKEIV